MDEPIEDIEAETRPQANGAIEGATTFVDVCKRCGTTAPADAMGLCSNPACHAVRRGAKLAAKYGPVNKARRKELRESFIRDYRPATTIDEVRCRDLADIVERLEVVKKGTMDHARLVQTRDATTAALEESRRARAERPKLESLTEDQIIAKLEGMLAQARETKALGERERANAEDAAPTSAPPNSSSEVREENRPLPDPVPTLPVASKELSRELWESVGIYASGGMVTHALGDEHAQKILSGQIPFQQAQAEESKRLRDLQAMADGRRA